MTTIEGRKFPKQKCKDSLGTALCILLLPSSSCQENRKRWLEEEEQPFQDNVHKSHKNNGGAEEGRIRVSVVTIDLSCLLRRAHPIAQVK
jgi:hypothetical protein